jgi:hypothetical protein
VIPSCESPPKYPPRSLAILTHLITGEALVVFPYDAIRVDIMLRAA